MPEAGSPRVSVLMCVFNDAVYLREAIDSVLAQTYADFELLIVDDGSTDESARLAASYCDDRVTVIRNSANLGLARALNRGLAAARGEFVARHDADDVSAPERFAKQVDFLDRRPHVAVAGTQATFIDATGVPKVALIESKATTPLRARWQIMFGSPLFHGSAMFRTHVVRDVFGGYDETVRVGEDYELWSRLMLAGEQLLNLPEVLLKYRVRSGSLSTHYPERDRQRFVELMTANIDAYAAIGPAAGEWKRIARAIAFGEPSGLADVRRLTAMLTAIRKAFTARCAPLEACGIDDDAARILVRAGALLYRRSLPAACYALARAVWLSPALGPRLVAASLPVAVTSCKRALGVHGRSAARFLRGRL